jgi:hypothetical protein
MTNADSRFFALFEIASFVGHWGKARNDCIQKDVNSIRNIENPKRGNAKK